MRILHSIALAFPLVLAAQPGNPVQAVPTPYTFGDVLSFRSNMLKQERILNVYLPEGYADSTLAYPVIYVLDGSRNEDFPHIAGLVQFLNMYGLLPPSIVVGIANNGRSRYHDFTGPTQSDSDKVWIPTYGGSGNFIRFLGEEVQPMVRAKYRTSGHCTLIGQSLGGLLGTEVLFTRPELFDDYILVSPSLWWNNGELAAHAAKWADGHGGLPKRVYIASSPGDAMMRKEINEVVKAFRKGTRPPFKYWHVRFPGESHATILHRAVYKAFEVLYPKQGK